jgi:hypothetical protein
MVTVLAQVDFEEVEAGKSNAIFEIPWSVTVTSAGKLKTPKVEQILEITKPWEPEK